MAGKWKVFYSILAGLMLSAPLTAISYFLYNVFEFPFLAFDLFDWVSRRLPGDLVTFGIDLMVDTIITLDLGREDTAAKAAERVMAVGMFVGLLVVAAVAFFFLAVEIHKRRPRRLELFITGAVFGGVLALPIAFISGDINVSSSVEPVYNTLFTGVAFVVWGTLLGWMFSNLYTAKPVAIAAPVQTKESTPALSEDATTPPSEALPAAPALPSLPAASAQVLNRRQFLVRVGSATATITLVGAGLAEILYVEEEIKGGNLDIDALRGGIPTLEPAPGTRPEYTPLRDHYRIDINSGRPPSIEESEWRLEIDGLVDNPVRLTLDDIRTQYTPMDQFITMGCISNRIGGSLISTILWTGVSMQQILQTVKPRENATHLKITAADGFDEFLALDVIRQDETVMLTYAWDGVPLPERHGFPLRIHIPNRFGMKQPKWIEKIEFVEDWSPGYWVRRGWSREAFVRTTSVIDTVATGDIYADGDKMRVPIGGIAWSGTRGISKVEVRVDNGDWLAAQIRTPLSYKTWVLWRLDWEFTEGEHTFYVRAYEADGTIQIEEMSDGVRPDGATGLHSREAAF